MSAYMVALIRRTLILVENAESEQDAIFQVEESYPINDGAEIEADIGDQDLKYARIRADEII